MWGTDLLDIEVPANGLFLAAFAVAFLLLLHFSVATSRLSEQTKILAQEVARLDGELRAAAQRPSANGSGPAEPEQAERRRASSRRARARSSPERPAAPRYGESSSGTRPAANSRAADRAPRLDLAALAQQARQPAQHVQLGPELLPEPAAGQRDEHERELGREQARHQHGDQRAPGRCG